MYCCSKEKMCLVLLVVIMLVLQVRKMKQIPSSLLNGYQETKIAAFYRMVVNLYLFSLSLFLKGQFCHGNAGGSTAVAAWWAFQRRGPFCQTLPMVRSWLNCTRSFMFNPLTPKSDQHLISPDNITPESNIRVTRKKKMIINLISSGMVYKFSLSTP